MHTHHRVDQSKNYAWLSTCPDCEMSGHPNKMWIKHRPDICRWRQSIQPEHAYPHYQQDQQCVASDQHMQHAPQQVARQNYQHAVHIAPPNNSGDAVQAIKDTALSSLNLMDKAAERSLNLMDKAAERAERAEQRRAEERERTEQRRAEERERTEQQRAEERENATGTMLELLHKKDQLHGEECRHAAESFNTQLKAEREESTKRFCKEAGFVPKGMKMQLEECAQLLSTWYIPPKRVAIHKFECRVVLLE